MMRTFWTQIVVLALLIGSSLALAAEDELAVATSIEQLDMTIRYHGEEILIFGEVQPGAEVLIKVISPLETARVKKKGKVFGFVWADVKRAEIRNIPGSYMEISSTTLDRLSPRLQRQTKIDGNYQFVRDMAQVIPADGDARFFLDGYIKVKEKQKLYSHREEAVDIIKERLFRTAIQLPSRAPTGTYRLEVNTVKENRLVGHGTATLRVERTGIEQWITHTARHHAALYGVLAVFIATLAGFGVGLIFKGRPL